MKRITILLTATIALMLGTCGPAHAQISNFYRDASVSYSDQYAGMIVSFAGPVDSVQAADTSNTFTFAGYQGESWYVNPIQYVKKLNATSGKPYCEIIFQGLIDSTNWTSIDTLGTVDSIETVQRGTLDFNNWKCKTYRMIVTPTVNGALTVSNDFDFSLYLFLPRKDN
ncbi:MAG: hypothetical protein WCW35_14630 [Bacteroidota bacterium]|jgi:hypothetical protein